MREQEFISQVQDRTGIASADAAEKAVRAALEVLSYRITEGDARYLASELPEKIARYVKPGYVKKEIDANDFLGRISDREDVDVSVASSHARAVFSLIGEMMPAEKIRGIQSNLPDEIAGMFGGPKGETRH